MKNQILNLSFLFSIMLIGCNTSDNKADAYGNFETDEITVSSQANGQIIWLSVEEGQKIDSGVVVGQIDTSQIALKIKQIDAQIDATLSRIPNINAQANVQREQIRILEVEQKRIKNLIANEAATQKQLDDIVGKISLAKKQIEAINTQHSSILSEIGVLDTQKAQLIDQLSKCKIRNPLNGSILTRFAQQGEVSSMGKPIYKIANIDYLYLKVFVSGDQLQQVVIGNEAKVYIDGKDGAMTEKKGIITWVSSSAEFTPKIIQTREERVKMVYAVKIKVKNEGELKIGMPAEVIFLGLNNL